MDDPAKPFDANGFTVMPPGGADWFVMDVPNGVMYFKKLPPDRLISSASAPAPIPRTFFVHVTMMRPGALSVSSADDLRRSAEQLLRNDAGPRYRLLEFEIGPYAAQGTDCVRYQARFDDRGSPIAPGAALEMNGSGFICRHPFAAAQAIHGSFSERRVSGASSPAGEAHRAEAEAVLGSVVFRPVR